MKLCKRLERVLTSWGEADLNKTTVTGTVTFPNQSPPRGAFDQAHHGVVTLLKEFGQLRDRRPSAPRVPGGAEEQLVLLRSYPRGSRRPFAKTKIATKLVTKPGEAMKPGGIGTSRAG